MRGGNNLPGARLNEASCGLLLAGCPEPDRIAYKLADIERSNDATCPGLVFANPELELFLDDCYLLFSVIIRLSEVAGAPESWKAMTSPARDDAQASHPFDRAYVHRSGKGNTSEESVQIRKEGELFLKLPPGENVIRLGAKLKKAAYSEGWTVPVRLVCAGTNDAMLAFKITEEQRRKHKFE